MTNGLSTVVEGQQLDAKTLLQVVSNGDCAALSAEQRVMYYKARCDAAGLDYRAQPFAYMKLQGKEVLYALKACTEQLSAKHGVRVEIIGQVTENGIRTVTVRATAKDGRATDEIGCVTIGNATGDQLANLYMKCVTKAKRRAVLSICGLGMLDETEVETIPQSQASTHAAMPPLKRKSDPPAPAPAAVEAPEPIVVVEPPTIDEINNKLSDGDVAPAKVVEAVGIEVTILEVTEKPTKNGGKKYGIKVKEPGASEPYYVNTFSETDYECAKSCKAKPESALIEKKPREYNGKTYWDLVSICPAIPF